MTLSIGTLVGYVDLETDKAEQSAGSLTGKLQSVSRVWERVLGDAGERAGKAAADGISELMESLPKNAKGTVSETSAAFRALSPAVQQSVLEAKAGAAAALADLPADAEAAGESSGEALGNGVLRVLPELLSRVESKWKAGLAIVATTAGAAFSASLAGAMDVEPSRDRVVAALGMTQEDAARIGRVSAALYADAWGDSAEEVDAALEAVVTSIKGMRTASEGELSKVTQAALTLSSTMQVDVVRAAQVAGNMVSNKVAKNGVQAMDLLASALSKVPVQLREDVMDAADEYGQFFTALGINGPKAMGLLVTAAGKGMYGIDKMGDAIKEFTIRATDGSKATSTAMESLGLDFHKVENDLLAGGGTANKAFNKIVDGLLAIKDPATRSQTALTLFGTPLEDLGTKDVPKFLRSLKTGAKGMRDFKGATDRMGATLNDNAKTNLTGFTRKLQTGFVNMIGGKVLPTITEWSSEMDQSVGPALRAVGKALARVTRFLAEHKNVTLGLIGVVLALTAVTAAHAAVLAVSAAGGLAKWLMQTRLISAATKVWAAVQWALNAAMSMNPIMLVVLAIGALVAAFVIAYKKSDTFRAIVQGAFRGIKAAASAVAAFFTEKIPAAFGKVKDAAGRALGWVKDNWPKILAFLTGPIGLAVYAIARNWDKIKAGARNARDFVVDKFTALVGFFKGLPGKIGNAVGGMFDGIKDAFRGAINWIIRKWNGLELKLKLPKIAGGGSVGIGTPDIPEFANGGRVTSDTIARIGEGREPESILPDSVLRGLLERAHNAGKASAAGDSSTRNAPLIGQVVQQPGESVDTLAERLWFKTRTRP